MIEKIKKFVQKHEMINEKDCIIVGVSGGADSVCLLFVLLELQKCMGFRMVVVHVNHGLRGAAAKSDQDYVEHVCREYGILYETYLKNVELIAKKRKQSTEEVGRNVRRECFSEAFRKYRGTKIALAHHKNDNAETFFLNLARGSGLKGLGGMKAVNGLYIRPLLCVERKEIEQYLQEKQIVYCQDITNQSDDYTRNRIRNHVISYMEMEVNPKLVSHMQETMEYLQTVQQYLDAECDQWERSVIRKKEGGACILQKSFLKMPDVLKPILVRRILAGVSKQEKDLEAVHVQSIMELFQKQSGRKIDLPYQMCASRIYDGVEIRRRERKSEEFLEIPVQACASVVQYRDYTISYRYWNDREVLTECSQKKYTKYFDCDIIKKGLTFRTRRPGDFITIHEDGRTQKLKSFFINEKIPQELRDQILLVADGSHILWIVGYRTNLGYLAKRNTKNIVEIQIDKGEDYGRKN